MRYRSQICTWKVETSHQKKVRGNGIKVPKRIDVSKLQIPEMRNNLCNTFENVEFDGTWDQLKTNLYNIGVDVLGLKKRKHRDWFDENDFEISKLIETKNLLHQKL